MNIFCISIKTGLGTSDSQHQFSTSHFYHYRGYILNYIYRVVSIITHMSKSNSIIQGGDAENINKFFYSRPDLISGINYLNEYNKMLVKINQRFIFEI